MDATLPVCSHQSPQGPSSRKRFITSCATCRRRKVRCDRRKPTCARCSISGYQCTYSSTELPQGPASFNNASERLTQLQAPRRIKASSENGTHDEFEAFEPEGRRQKQGIDVLERLHRLEEIVRQHVVIGATGTVPHQAHGENGNGVLSEGRSNLPQSTNQESLRGTRTRIPQGSGVAEVHSGKLLVEAGRTRYVSPLFWGVITEEIQDLSSLALEESPTNAQSPPLSTPNHPSPDYLGGQSTSHRVSFDEDHLFSLVFPSANITATTSTHQYLPSRSQAEFLLAVFKRRVDPLLRLLHIPSFDAAFTTYYDNIDPSSSSNSQPPFTGRQEFTSSSNSWPTGVYQGSSGYSFEALLFAVFYAAVNSLTEEEVAQHLHSSRREFGAGTSMYGCTESTAWRPRLLAEYKRAIEQSLVKAKFLEQADLVTVMAFAILLICLCHEADVPSLYPLTGLLLRTAQSLGLHRDPALLFSTHKPVLASSDSVPQTKIKGNITPIEAEIRRRLWHHICHLDLRVCEAHGPDPGILLEEKMWPLGPGTRFPRCIDDEDLLELLSNPMGTTSTANGPPLQDPGRFTRMTIQLVRFNASLCVRRIMNPAAAPFFRTRAHSENDREFQEEELRREAKADLDAMLERNERFYLRYCDDDDNSTGVQGAGHDDIPALKKMTKAVARMAEAKLRMMYYHRFVKGKKSGDQTESWVLRKSIVNQSLDLIQCRNELLADPTLTPYHWHIKVHTQFHATFHILSELCAPEFRAEDCRALREKAWAILNSMDWGDSEQGVLGDKLVSERGKERDLLRRLRLKAERAEVGRVHHSVHLPIARTGHSFQTDYKNPGDATPGAGINMDSSAAQNQAMWSTDRLDCLDSPEGSGWMDSESIYDHGSYPFGQGGVPNLGFMNDFA